MWLLTPTGFFSIVRKSQDAAAGTLTVRSRVRAALDDLRAHLLPELGPTIEHAGGSARCMLAGIHLPPRAESDPVLVLSAPERELA